MPVTDRFRIVFNPKLACESDAPEILDYVEVVASRDGEVDRLWRVEVENLVDLFDIIKPAETAVNMICDLRDGTAVTLPGDYSGVHLIQLGFRMPFKKAPRESNIPNIALAKFIQTTETPRFPETSESDASVYGLPRSRP
jgi:hypothetical protein